MLVEPHLAIYGWTSNSSNCFDWDVVTCNLNAIVVEVGAMKRKVSGYFI
jgi:hypothetical protein